MFRLRRNVLGNVAAAAVPVGMAAAFVCQAPAVSAAAGESHHRAAAASPLVRPRPHSPARPAARHRHRHRHGLPARLRAYAWAVRQAGHPYAWGGTGPGYDCSGLVMMAYRHAGIRLPRTTYRILASPLLRRVRHPRKGDLAFYGSGHVELFRARGYTFGAHDYGSPVGLTHYGWGWVPTAFYRVR
jgi:cell wall-associated NlpC family hydrolase